MATTISTKRPKNLNHLSSPGTKQGHKRSILSFCGDYRLGIGYKIATHIRSHGAAICSCTERYHQETDAFGSHYVIEATPETIEAIEADSFEAIAEGLERIENVERTRYQITIVAPDSDGILASIGEVLSKRNITIYSNDSVTFVAPQVEELGGTGEMTTMASVVLLIGIETTKHDEILDSLKDGLEYLEHRYHWYICLETRKGTKKRRQKPSKMLMADSLNCSELN